ncbi:MAG: UPF0182 family protein [Acidobacteria bacterium]|nr:UPF0182 family protein [Acidobacteriota bacterium]
MRRINPLWLLLISLIVLYLLLRFGAGLLMDWYWYQETGYTQVFITMLRAELVLGVGTGLMIAGFILMNALLAIKGNRFVVVQQRPGIVDLGEMPLAPSLLKWIAAAISLLLGFLAGSSASGRWEEVMKFLYAQRFGKMDPVLEKDIGFYIFKLPVYSAAIQYVFLAVVISLLLTAGVYFLAGQFAARRGFLVGGKARRHLLLLLALLLLLMCLSGWLEIFSMMTSQSGLFAGPGYTDVHARMPLARASAVLLGALSLFVAVAAFTRIPYAVPATAALYVMILLVKLLYPSAVQKFVVAPSELARETPFILHNIQATREAFNLDRVDERELTLERTLSKPDIERNTGTIKNIRLWDHGPLLDTFSQIQEIRTYYDFVSVDNDRYVIDGQLQQVMLSARELSAESLPNRNWINEHLSFTHGFGLTLGPVNRVTAEGLPVLLVKDIPPRSLISSLDIARPQIYFGELTNNYVISNTKGGEFDYPAGEKNVYRDYDGAGGVPVKSLFRRIVFAAGMGSTDILFSGLIDSNSRVLYHRNLQERISRLAPYLRLDRDPYLVISRGKLYWLQDAYTGSDRYPYAQSVEQVGNYIRNSVKVLVDAYDGTVRFYAADPSDPILQTYARIFTGMFRSLTDLPEDLRRHLRYPEDIFSIQTSVYSTYHMAQAQIFYNKEDQWEVPVLTHGQRLERMSPYYTIMKLSGEAREEFILMLPFSPRNKDNLAAWMVARSDGDDYGKLVVYLFPKQRLIYGPKQMDARINQDPEISRQLTLWDQRGSEVIQGTLLVIPIEETLIYVRPIYLRAENGKIPELKRIIVAYENRIAMEETLEQSLAKIFGTDGGVVPARTQMEMVSQQPVAPQAQIGAASMQRDQLIQEAAKGYERAMQAQREGDWAVYGEEIRKVGQILQRLSQQREN